MEKHLKVSYADLNPIKDKVPAIPRYYHFKESVAERFYEASLITYTRADGTEIVLKDLYSRR